MRGAGVATETCLSLPTPVPDPRYPIAFLLTQRGTSNDVLCRYRALTGNGLLEPRPFSKPLTNQK